MVSVLDSGLNIADSPTCHTHPILSVKIRKEAKEDGEETAESNGRRRENKRRIESKGEGGNSLKQDRKKKGREGRE